MAVVFSVFLIPNQSFAELVKLWPDAINVSGTDGWSVTYGYGRKASDGSLFAYYHVKICNNIQRETNIFLQKIDKNGQKLWGDTGRLVYNSSSCGRPIVDLAPDQNGGAVVVWRFLELRAKRFDSNGNEDLSWGTDGVLIASSAGCSVHCSAVTDGAGGVIVVWKDGSDIVAQRVGSDGQLKWNNGQPVFVGTGSLYHGWTEANNAVPDGNGGVFIDWRGQDSNNNRVVFAQHLDSNGNPQWPSGGLIATSAYGYLDLVADLIPDGTGGVIIIATGDNGTNQPIIAQRIDSMGNLQWGNEGFTVKNAESCWSPRYAFIESVGNGEFVVVWDSLNADAVTCDESDVYAQKIDLNGNLKWASEGVIVSSLEQFDFFPHVTTDGIDGVWISFTNGDTDYDTSNGNGYVGVQHVDNDGNLFVCTPIRVPAYNDFIWSHSIVPDDEGRVYILWDGVDRLGDVYAQRFGKVGTRQICGAIPVTIDIKPGEVPNVINLNSNGSVPVAVFTTDDFDAATIDVGTVIFAGASVVNSGLEDVDGDGRMDMVFHFHTQDLQLDPSSTTATLTGKTLDGTDFVGEDSVVVQ
ncbi:MAG: hypothetical protein ACYSTI_13180 [Planctomycetota bacterium]